MKVEHLRAIEILDSRGRPTLLTQCTVEGSITGKASVPSGASRGQAEALELRDGDPHRYGGLGCRKAVVHVNTIMNDSVSGRVFANQKEFDSHLIALDGTSDKSRLGANAILSASLAFARAFAHWKGIPLFEYLGSLVGNHSFRLPRPTINLFSGGKHAGGQIPLQDLLIIPASAATMDQCLADTYAVYQSAAVHIREKYGMRALTADEGGLAPEFASVTQMLDDSLEAIRATGLTPGKDIFLALDVASSHFFSEGSYHIGEDSLSSQDMVDLLTQWVHSYPILSVEDGLAEEDWSGWQLLVKKLNSAALVLGDDLLCTQVSRIQHAIDNSSANALLLKVNQCGTLTEAADAYLLARSAGWQITISARSGETEDDWLADLAVGWAGDQIKIGSITQSERLTKYNRLLEIENDHGFQLNPWPASH